MSTSRRIDLQRLNNGMLYTNCNDEQTALILALAHQTGWSADRISLALMKTKLMKDVGRIQAECIWVFFSNWISSHRFATTPITIELISTMNEILEEEGIILAAPGKPLHQTSCPTTILFTTTTWAPDTGKPLIPNFTVEMRVKNKQWMRGQSERVLLRTPSPRELIIMDSFGVEMGLIFKHVLRRWAKAVQRTLRNRNDKVQGLRPIKKDQQIALIMEYMDEYVSYFETRFGKIESTKQEIANPNSDEPRSLTVQSTAFAGKIFLSLIMADRLDVVERTRMEGRKALGQFVYLNIDELKDKSCDICYADFCPEEDKPVQLLCCFNILGEGCIKRTIATGILDKKKSNVSCPVCRREFPQELLAKINPGEEEEHHDDEDGPVQDVNVIVEAVPEIETVVILIDVSEPVERGVLANAGASANMIEDAPVPSYTVEESPVNEGIPSSVVEDARIVPEPANLVNEVEVQANNMEDVRLISEPTITIEEVLIHGELSSSIIMEDVSVTFELTHPVEETQIRANAAENARILCDRLVATEEVSVSEQAFVDIVMEDVQLIEEEQVLVNVRMATEEVVQSTGVDLRV